MIKLLLTKTDLRKSFTDLRLKPFPGRFRVMVFQTDKMKRKQEKDMTDILILDKWKGKAWFIELKTKNDKLSVGQTELQNDFEHMKKFTNDLRYRLVTQENVQTTINEILQSLI